MQSRVADLGGPVHYADFGGDGPLFVLVHGLGGAHVNWLSVAPALAERGRVLAVDLIGFGRTPRAGRSSTVSANREVLERFVEEVGGGPAILIGNSMGGLLSMLVASSRPRLAAGLVLVNPALPRTAFDSVDRDILTTFAAYMVPGVGERFVRRRIERLGPDGVVAETLARCAPDVARISQEVVDAHVALARERLGEPDAGAATLQAARSLVPLLGRRRAFRRVVNRITAPTLLLGGAEDRLVLPSAMRALAEERPDWSHHEFADLGHIPMLEHPEAFLGAVGEWLDGPGRVALVHAAPAAGGAAPA